MTTGIVGGDVGRQILAGLTAEGIGHDYVCAVGESRQTVTLVEPDATTVLLEPGPPVSAEVLDNLAAKVAAWSAHVPAVAITGSLPPGAPASYVARLVEDVRGASSAYVAVDASGDALRHAALAGPHLIKVNTDEYEQRVSHVRRNTAGRRASVRNAGCRRCGNALYHRRSAGSAHPLRTRSIRREDERRTTRLDGRRGRCVSCRFAICARRRGDALQEAARLASAAAAAAVLTVEAGFIEQAAVDAALERTELLDAADFFAEAQP